MTKNIHLIGMGITGSILAWNLHQHGYTFTWDDNESTVCSWKATTGLTYPSGDPLDMHAYAIWKHWCEEQTPWPFSGIVETCPYWFASKHPPHGGNYAIQRDIGPLRLGALPSYHLNGQRLVTLTRKHFASKRHHSPPPDSQIIVSHGFSNRLHHYLWGWMVKVKLQFAPELLQDGRPMLYLRKGRFQLGYANPVPGEPYYYAGSSLIVQHAPKSLAIEPKFEWWKKHLATMTEGKVRVTAIGEKLEGWRPAAEKEDTALITEQQGIWLTLPLWSSGIRHAPLLCEAVLHKLQGE